MWDSMADCHDQSVKGLVKSKVVPGFEFSCGNAQYKVIEIVGEDVYCRLLEPLDEVFDLTELEDIVLDMLQDGAFDD